MSPTRLTASVPEIARGNSSTVSGIRATTGSWKPARSSRQGMRGLWSFWRDRRYSRTLEIGCGAGAFTRLLAGVSERVVALDVSPAAIERARPPRHRRQRQFRRGQRHLHGDRTRKGESLGSHRDERDGLLPRMVVPASSTFHGWRIGCSRSRPTAAASSWRILSATLPVICCSRALIRTYRDLCVNVGFVLELERRCFTARRMRLSSTCSSHCCGDRR